MNRVLLLKTSNNIPIDIALGALPFEATAAERARDVEVYPGITLRFCAPEDLIVMKAFAGRSQDWEDVRMTLVRQGVESLDWKHIRQSLKTLLIGQESEALDKLEELRERYS